MLAVVDPISAIIWYIITVAITAGLTYLGGRLLAKEPPKEKRATESPEDRLWNPHTTQQEGIARPRAYGKNMHLGNIVAKWTGVVDDHEILHMVLEHGDGPTKGIISAEVFINDQPAANFGSVTVQERKGTMNQSVMSGFEKTKLEYSVDTELIYGEDATVFTTPNDFFDDLEWTLSFPQGIRKHHKDGGTASSAHHVHVRISEHGLGSWTTLFDANISGNTAEPLFKLYTANTLVPGSVVKGKQYDLEFSSQTAPAERHTFTCLFRSVREVVSVAFTKPGKALVGITAVATAQLSGSIDVKVIREDRIINTYNGTSWTLEYSRNRAWVTWDILTQPVISGDGSEGLPYVIERYDGIDPQYLDLEFFYAWAQFTSADILDGYGSTEPRAACDLIVEEFTDCFTLAHDVAAIGRANIYWRGDKLTGWIDDAVTTPMDLVTMDSVMAKTWKNSWAIESELAGVVEVFYKDARQGYERTPAEFSNEDAGGFRNIVSVEGTGLTSAGSAVHYAHYMLERNRLIRNTNRFRVHKDGFRYNLGDVIRLQSRPANWGSAFRVMSATVDTITVDRNAEAEASIGDVLFIRSYDTVTEEIVTDVYEVLSVAAKVIQVTVNWNIAPVKGNIVAVGAAGAIKLRRIVQLEPTVDNYFDVTVETYDVTLYDADDIDPANPNVNYIWPGPVAHKDRPITRAEVDDLIIQRLPPPLDTEMPVLSNCTFTGSGGTTVAWTATDGVNPITFRYRGVTYEITADNTTDEYIYWKIAATAVFSHTNLLSTVLAAGGWVMCQNKAGVAYPTFAQQVIHGGLIQAGTITAAYAQIADAAIVTAKIANLAVETLKIKDVNVTTGKIADSATKITNSASGTNTTSSSSSWTTVCTLSITSLGGTVEILAQALISDTDEGIDQRVRIYNNTNGTTIFEKEFSPNSATLFMSQGCLEIPGAGGRQYLIQMKSDGANSFTLSSIILLLSESKGK